MERCNVFSVQECLESLHEGRQYIVQYIMQSEASDNQPCWSIFLGPDLHLASGNFRVYPVEVAADQEIC